MEKSRHRSKGKIDLGRLRGYTGARVLDLCKFYESWDFAVIHQHWLSFLPKRGSAVLDVGAGSGRDAIAMSRLGFKVLAVEPSPDMLEAAKAIHPSSDVVWIQDSLPLLPSIRLLHRRFDLILLSAVWMHLDKTERKKAMLTLHSLANPGGVVVITIRHPPDKSRRMFNVSAQETKKLGLESGFIQVASAQHQDPFGGARRSAVAWSVHVLKPR
jgi:SAM-dependent methyltransferase